MVSFLTKKFCCGEDLFANTWNFISRRWENSAWVGTVGTWGHFDFAAGMRMA